MKTLNVREILWLSKKEIREQIRLVSPRLRLASRVYELTKWLLLLTVSYNIGQIATVPGDVSPASVYGYGSLYVLAIATVAFLGMLMYRDTLAWYKYHLADHLESIKNISWA